MNKKVNPKSLANLVPAKKGEVRNPKGINNRSMEAYNTLMGVLMEIAPGEESGGKTNLELIIRGLVAAAVAKQPWAVHEVLDRGMGRSPVSLASPNDEPIEIVMRVVPPNAKD